MASPNDNYPEVNEHFPDFDFNLLAVPPPEWELYDIPDKTHLRNRAFDLQTFKNLAKHHCWGINVIIGERKTKERLLQVLKRIVYNQQQSLRPTWHQFVSQECDAGPRLLRRSYNALQISRRYPLGVPNQPLSLPPQPVSTLIAASNRSNFPVPAQAQLQTLPQQSANLPMSAYGGFSHGNVQHTRQNCQVGVANGQNSSHAPYPGNSGILHQKLHNTHQPSPAVGETRIASSSKNPSVENNHRLDQFHALAQSELYGVIGRAVMNYVYKNLDEHLDSGSLPPHHISYSRSSAGNEIRGCSSFSHIQLALSDDLAKLHFDRRGSYYPFRGRGPMSLDNTSDAVDCIIVAGLLTNIGSTPVDRPSRPNWHAKLTALEKDFLAVLNGNNDDIRSDDWAIRANEKLKASLDAISNANGQVRDRFVRNPLAVWKYCAKNFDQFRLERTEKTYLCDCQGAQIQSSDFTSNFMVPDFAEKDKHGVSVNLLMHRFFARVRHSDCPHCGTQNSTRVERLFRKLPLRLVIQPDPRCKVQNQNNPFVSINYSNDKGREKSAVYRLLGGIFHTEVDGRYHFRVCWNDNNRDALGNHIRLYDASQISGIIAGGIEPNDTGELAPGSWWPGGYAPLLFYERVFNPSDDVLSEVRNIAQNMLKATKSGQFILPQLQTRTNSISCRPSNWADTNNTNKAAVSLDLASDQGTAINSPSNGVARPSQKPTPRTQANQSSGRIFTTLSPCVDAQSHQGGRILNGNCPPNLAGTQDPPMVNGQPISYPDFPGDLPNGAVSGIQNPDPLFVGQNTSPYLPAITEGEMASQTTGLGDYDYSNCGSTDFANSFTAPLEQANGDTSVELGTFVTSVADEFVSVLGPQTPQTNSQQPANSNYATTSLSNRGAAIFPSSNPGRMQTIDPTELEFSPQNSTMNGSQETSQIQGSTVEVPGSAVFGGNSSQFITCTTYNDDMTWLDQFNYPAAPSGSTEEQSNGTVAHQTSSVNGSCGQQDYINGNYATEDLQWRRPNGKRPIHFDSNEGEPTKRMRL